MAGTRTDAVLGGYLVGEGCGPFAAAVGLNLRKCGADGPRPVAGAAEAGCEPGTAAGIARCRTARQANSRLGCLRVARGGQGVTDRGPGMVAATAAAARAAAPPARSETMKPARLGTVV